MILVKGWYFPNFDHHLSSKVDEFPHTTYQQYSIDKAFEKTKEFNQVIDVGANIGLHSVRFSKYFTEVIAFEPVSQNFNCLKINCSKFSNTKLNHCGLGDTEGKLIISIPHDSTNCGEFSLIDFTNYKDTLIQESIDIKKLDSFNLSPDLIKIDTQGYEINVLRGAEETILKHKPVILAECETKKQFNEINLFLSHLGYIFFTSDKKDKIWIFNDFT
jgi:FkbM family methyltransferase